MNKFKNLSKDDGMWLNDHIEIADKLYEVYEDAINVNPDEENLYENLAVKSLKATIEATKQNLIDGPYNEAHFSLIKLTFPDFVIHSHRFWQFFTNCCAVKNTEGDFSNEQIYFSALNEIAVLTFIEEVNVNEYELGGEVFDMNKDSIEKIMGEGVNARFSI